VTRWIARAVGVALLALAAGFALLLVRALALPSRQLRVEPAARLAVDAPSAAGHLAAAIRFPTVSHQDAAADDPAALAGFQTWLEASYPALHAALERERLPGGALLYTWKGRRPDLEPLLLLAHQDVVPADPAGWSHPPFAGEIADGFVWGRGAIDDKGSLVAICEAVEGLAARGFAPERSVLLAFGQDEEVGGDAGARRVAEALAARGVRARFALDEGMGVIAGGFLPGLSRPVAGIAIAEKGYATLELRVASEGGHSSTPPRHTAAGIVASGVAALEAHPMPARVGEVTGAFFRHIAPEMPLALRVPLANADLLVPIFAPWLSEQPAVNALLRTTTAATMLSGSAKDNVLPTLATADVNFRIAPGDTIAGVVDHARRAVDDPRVEIAPQPGAREPSPVSPVDGEFEQVQRTIGEIFPAAIVAPMLTLGGTDARHYDAVSTHLYRFAPFEASAQDLKRIHGIDERMAVDGFADAVRFYTRLIENATSP
jgi:carboxypeptidase PM20D1